MQVQNVSLCLSLPLTHSHSLTHSLTYLQGEAGRRANEEAVDTEGGIGLEHMPGDGLTAIVASVRREAARRLDLGPRL